MKDNITEKVIKEDVLIEQKLDYKIEIAAQTLDRNINFITNCDNKTSNCFSYIWGPFDNYSNK